MKKIIAVFFMLFAFTGGSFAFEDIFVEEKPPVTEQQTAQKEVTVVDVPFDWFDISDKEKTARINDYSEIIFGENSKIKDFKHHYMLANNGVTEDEDAKYNPFYYKNNTLVIYAIMYNNDPHHALYYNPYGKLFYVDITSDEYPNFPYYSMQYDRKGNLKSAIYFVSHDIQYMFNAKKEFIGIWYKDKMYNIENKQISTREGW